MKTNFDLPPAKPEPGVHANLVGAAPGPPTPWLDWDGVIEAEDRQARFDRVTPYDASVPEGTPLGMVPTPWGLERAERVAIAGEMVRRGLRGADVDDAIDREIYRRRITADRQRLAGIVELFRNLGG